ncbi:MAG: hypothetical protein VX087_01210 [Pseudomonadota bacterium]|nr:hypothetical protein [Pseudomonadota bacterium]
MRIHDILLPIINQDQLLKKTFNENLTEDKYQEIITDMISEISLNPSRYSNEIHQVLLLAGIYKDPLGILRNYYSKQDYFAHIFNYLPDYYILQIFSNTYDCCLVIVNKFNQKIIVRPGQCQPQKVSKLDEEFYPNNCFWIYYIDGCFLSWSQIHYK